MPEIHHNLFSPISNSLSVHMPFIPRLSLKEYLKVPLSLPSVASFQKAPPLSHPIMYQGLSVQQTEYSRNDGMWLPRQGPKGYHNLFLGLWDLLRWGDSCHADTRSQSYEAAHMRRNQGLLWTAVSEFAYDSSSLPMTAALAGTTEASRPGARTTQKTLPNSWPTDTEIINVCFKLLSLR